VKNVCPEEDVFQKHQAYYKDGNILSRFVVARDTGCIEAIWVDDRTVKIAPTNCGDTSASEDDIKNLKYEKVLWKDIEILIPQK
jgi:hypothetical protein